MAESIIRMTAKLMIIALLIVVLSYLLITHSTSFMKSIEDFLNFFVK